MNILVKKYGGATLSTPEKIRAIAKDLAQCHAKGEKLVVVVSAMGQTTNDLIHLAQQISPRPKRRELDMLLTTGERISMSLLAMALNDLKTPAISLTGSQAGVLTDDDHLNASIIDVNCPRVLKHLEENKVVIIAGFQGVSPTSKEITTLGRGGSDTTAVAMAAALKAQHCEILKDVAGIYSADPKLCPSARPIRTLPYQQILEMTFWGAKVLHYRSVELAASRKVKIYIGPAHDLSEGTWVTEENKNMYESVKILSINSHRQVLALDLGSEIPFEEAMTQLERECSEREIAFPQILAIETLMANPSTAGALATATPTPTTTTTAARTPTITLTPARTQLFLTGPDEILGAIRREIKSFPFAPQELASVTATCTGASTPELCHRMMNRLNKAGLSPLRVWLNGMSVSFLVPREQGESAVKTLHEELLSSQ